MKAPKGYAKAMAQAKRSEAGQALKKLGFEPRWQPGGRYFDLELPDTNTVVMVSSVPSRESDDYDWPVNLSDKTWLNVQADPDRESKHGTSTVCIYFPTLKKALASLKLFPG